LFGPGGLAVSQKPIPTYVAHIQATDGGYRAVVTRDAEQVYEGKARPNRKAARVDAAEFVVGRPEEQRRLQWDDPFLNEPDDEVSVGREEADDVCGDLARLQVDGYVRERHRRLWRVLSSAGGSGAPADERVTAALLAPVVAAVSHTNSSDWETATYVLLVLTDYFIAAQQAVSRMARDSQYLVRVSAMLGVGRRAPRSLRREVLKRGLSDRSALVRRHAANQVVFHDLRELLPALETAAARERKADVRREIERCHLRLRDGYILTPVGGDNFDLSVAFERGGFGTKTVSRAELEARGVEALAAAFRASRR
jgi:hypothetical protein